MSDRPSPAELSELRDSAWLLDRERGRTTAEIAAKAGVSRSYVARRLRLAREAQADREARADDPPKGLTPSWLDLVPLFPIGPFTPSSECPHKGPIPEGSKLCCMVCSASGMDDHPALARDASATAPPPTAPDGSAAARTSPARASRAGAVSEPAAPDPTNETRRDRRRRLFAGRPAAA